MIAVICSAAPSFMLVVIPLMFIYKRIQSYYLATSRELKRLDATTKSPIFASFQVRFLLLSIRLYSQFRFRRIADAVVDRKRLAESLLFVLIDNRIDSSVRTRLELIEIKKLSSLRSIATDGSLFDSR